MCAFFLRTIASFSHQQLMNTLTISLFLLISFFIGTSGQAAQELTVGTIERPPFSFTHNEKPTGFSVELWEAIAQEAQLNYQWVEHQQFADMIDATISRHNDLAIANISITSEREIKGDFSHPIFQSGMAIAVQAKAQPSYLSIIWESGVMLFLLGAFAILLIIAHILWFFERHVESARHDYFRDDYIGGVWDAFWWAFIIMTMGGFEKEVPHKIISRILAMLWIIISLFFISAITAQMTTALTVAELKTDIENYQDLKGKRVGVTANSSHETFLKNNGIATIEYSSLNQMYQDLKQNKLDAIVADYPVLSYYTHNKGAGWMSIAGEIFNPDAFGIFFPENSPLLEQVNTALLKLKEKGIYDKIKTKYFGTKN